MRKFLSFSLSSRQLGKAIFEKCGVIPPGYVFFRLLVTSVLYSLSNFEVDGDCLKYRSYSDIDLSSLLGGYVDEKGDCYRS